MPLDGLQRERYVRQLTLPQLGVAGQKRLLAARVTIVGVGGLGASVATYLAAAGVGWLQLIDPDPVERSNLHRQVLYRESDVGRSKVRSARDHLAALNPEIQVNTQEDRLISENAESFLRGSHLVIDGSDNYPTRWVIHRACGALALPWVYGAAEALAGQLSVFWPNRAPGHAPCYACLYPEQAEGDSGGCSQQGVLGMVPAVIAQLQAMEAIKLLSGMAEPRLGTLICYDAMAARLKHVAFTADPACECRAFPVVQ